MFEVAVLVRHLERGERRVDPSWASRFPSAHKVSKRARSPRDAEEDQPLRPLVTILWSICVHPAP
jgi:hypothetical protein